MRYYHRRGHGPGIFYTLVEMADAILRRVFRSTRHGSEVLERTAEEGASDRIERVRELAARGGAEAVAELEAMTRDPNRAVRTFASSTLANLRGGVR